MYIDVCISQVRATRTENRGGTGSTFGQVAHHGIYTYISIQSSYYYSDRCVDDLETKLGKHGLDQPSVKWHITAYIHISAYKVLIIIQIVVRMTWKQNWGSMGWINLRSSGTSRHIYIYQQ